MTALGDISCVAPSAARPPGDARAAIGVRGRDAAPRGSRSGSVSRGATLRDPPAPVDAASAAAVRDLLPRGRPPGIPRTSGWRVRGSRSGSRFSTLGNAEDAYPQRCLRDCIWASHQRRDAQMSVSTAVSGVAELIDAFAAAAPDRLDAEYQVLVAALWHDGEVTAAALPAVPELVARLEEADDRRKGYLAVLLGLLAEAEYPAADGEITTAVRGGLDRYLGLLGSRAKDDPLSLAVRYLLSHFPGDRDPILAVAAGLDLDPDDLSRLDRALAPLDPGRPELGRVFPSPAVWTLEESEREFDQGWIRTLSPEQIVGYWQDDTHTVFGSTGANAYWAVRNGTPQTLPAPVLAPRDSIPRPADPDTDIFGPHAAALRCPDCGGRLEFEPRAARCTGCPSAYPIASGILDLTAPIGAGAGAGDFQFKLAEMPSMGLFYEAHARPNFLRVAGSNWGGQVSPADEDAYIARHVRPVDGPVLDLAAGAGRWTDVLASAVGSARVIALDLNPPMLTVLR